MSPYASFVDSLIRWIERSVTYVCVEGELIRRELGFLYAELLGQMRGMGKGRFGLAPGVLPDRITLGVQNDGWVPLVGQAWSLLDFLSIY